MATDLSQLNTDYREGYAVTITYGISAHEALCRLAGRSVTTIELDWAEAIMLELNGIDAAIDNFPDLDEEELQGASMGDAGSIIRALETPGWALTIQNFGGTSSGHEPVSALSRQTRTVGLSSSVNSSAWICYGENERILSSFDPLFPEADYGSDPNVLVLRAGVYQPEHGIGREYSFESRLRWIGRGLSIDLPPGGTTGKLPAAKIGLSHFAR